MASLDRGDSVVGIDTAAAPAGLDEAHWIRCDITNDGEIASAVGVVDSVLGGCDVLFNNAGVRHAATPLLETTAHQWRSTLDVNLTGAFLCLRSFARGMASTGAGVIVNTVSQLADSVVTGHSAYAVSKAALKQLTTYAAAELGPLGLRVIGVAPGIVDTPMTSELSSDSDWVSARLQRIPLGRFASAAEIAEAMQELSTDRFAYAHGTTIVLDGGYLSTR